VGQQIFMSEAAMLIYTYQFWLHEELLCDLGSSQTIQTLVGKSNLGSSKEIYT